MYRIIFQTALLVLLISTTAIGQARVQAQIVDDVDEYVEHALGQFHSHFDLTVDEPIMEMAIIAVYITESDEIAEELYKETVDSLEDDDSIHDLLLSDWEGIGDEAVTGSFTQDDIISTLAVAREDNILVISAVVSTEEMPDIPAELVEYIFETGPSDSEITYDSEGRASGGWADAFPSKGDIDAISHMESGDVVDLFSVGNGGVLVNDPLLRAVS